MPDARLSRRSVIRPRHCGNCPRRAPSPPICPAHCSTATPISSVHSFKDLPIEMPAGTVIAGALPRADARDVLADPKDRDHRAAERAHASCRRRRAATWLLGENAAVAVAVASPAVDDHAGSRQHRNAAAKVGRREPSTAWWWPRPRSIGCWRLVPPFEREADLIRGFFNQCEWMVHADARVSVGARPGRASRSRLPRS